MECRIATDPEKRAHGIDQSEYAIYYNNGNVAYLYREADIQNSPASVPNEVRQVYDRNRLTLLAVVENYSR